MYKIPKKSEDRLIQGAVKFQKVLEIAKARDLNESDTVSIITDMLDEIFGYDKYLEVTSELAIRGTYCDLAIKLNGKIEYLIECKSIGTELKDKHVKQALDYGANQGVKWIILTNGATWRLYRLRFEQPIDADLVFELDFTKINPRKEEERDPLCILHRCGIGESYREQNYEIRRLINPHNVVQVILTEPVLTTLRRELKKLGADIKLSVEDIQAILTNSVIKRDLLESEEAKDAEKLVRKLLRGDRKSREKKEDAAIPEDAAPSEKMSVTEQLLKEVPKSVAPSTAQASEKQANPPLPPSA